MNTLEQCLLGLVNSGDITRQEAMGKASNIKALLVDQGPGQASLQTFSEGD